MRILTVVFSLGKGGTERAAQNFAVAYAEAGHDSRILFTELDGIRGEFLRVAGIPLYSLANEEELTQLAVWDPDIVHLHSHLISHHAFRSLKWLFPESIFVETNVFSRPSPWVNEIQLSFQLSAWAEWLYQKRAENPVPSTMVSYPVDTSSFQRSPEVKVRSLREKWGLSSQHILLGRIGQSSKFKWSNHLIDIFDNLRDHDNRLKLIVVNPPETILTRIRKSAFKNDIIILDQILGDEALSDCYSAIDIFVHISDIGESFGMVIAEAMLCETPVVSVATPWADNSQGEVIGNRMGGFVASKISVLPSLIQKLIHNHDLRIQMGKAGRERIIGLYDSRKLASDVLNACTHHQHFTKKIDPVTLMTNTEGPVNKFSKIILKSGRFLILLRLTTGYTSLTEVPLIIIKKIYRLFERET
jgi:glycosyltransferase involved in cell wall biosynthesis